MLFNLARLSIEEVRTLVTEDFGALSSNEDETENRDSDVNNMDENQSDCDEFSCDDADVEIESNRIVSGLVRSETRTLGAATIASSVDGTNSTHLSLYSPTSTRRRNGLNYFFY